jgi:hypothetical protein
VHPSNQSTPYGNRPSGEKKVNTTLTINTLTINTDSKSQRQRRVSTNTQSTINTAINAFLSIINSLTNNTGRRGQEAEQFNPPERQPASRARHKIHDTHIASRWQECELRGMAR